MLWLMTMGRRLNGVYAAFMLVAFMMGVAGALHRMWCVSWCR